MAENIYDPLEEYVNVFRDRFQQVARDTFAALAAEAKVDVEANRSTCKHLYDTEKALRSIKSSIGWTTFLCVALWLVVAGGALWALLQYARLPVGTLIAIAAAVLLALVLLFTLVHPHLKRLKGKRDQLQQEADRCREEAWKQMAPLNRLYDWDVLTRMMSKTVPRLEFDPYFTTQRLADLKEVYGWNESFNKERSVIYSHSGLINGNPFVLCRTRKMEMGTKTYVGYKTIHWTTQERGTDGKVHTVHHSQTLTASVTAPYPEYYEKTRLIYGNTAAPDLVFYRKQSGLASKEGSLSFRWKRHALRRKARNLDSKDFAMLTNEEFEVAFDTSNRNSNQQFALLFTPLAQNSMMRLLQDQEAGYGDDFDFDKNRMINAIIPEHLQSIDLDMNPSRYQHFDYDVAEREFLSTNAAYFRAIYFSLAPLLCVPMYQQIRPPQDIYGRDMPRHSAYWEHEALANFWGQDRFKHPSCVTHCILKTEQQAQGDESLITVHAYGYRSEQRISYISKLGGDGRIHQVPVIWYEYLPVTGTGQMRIREDNSQESEQATQQQRMEHISDILRSTHLDIYRRHIASKA